MKQLILDGYNVIHDLSVLKKNLMLSLEDARTALVNFMQIWANNHAYKGKISIIFDGTDGVGTNGQSLPSNNQSSSNNSQPIHCNNRYTGSNIQVSSSNSQASLNNSRSSFNISQTARSVNCIYSNSGQKADDYIISLVKEIKNRSCITIVSNDNYIRGTCISLGAATERPSFLVDSPKIRKCKITSQKSSKKISPTQEKEINEFLKEKWGI